jgi:hypothetical protein
VGEPGTNYINGITCFFVTKVVESCVREEPNAG